MKVQIGLAIAAAAAMFTGVMVSQPAEARSCGLICNQQYNLCLANTPHHAFSCREILRSCLAGCNFYP